ncbi:MAG: hypothetical protein Q7K21_01915, partial [Elusimicrobiota bacterium]|nr:hypothetical protein [Elusimicrobiota bacterium]
SGIIPPGVDVSDLTGRLIVIEGTDGVGRSTQIANIKEWLEVKGYAVQVSGWARSPLIGRLVKEAKAGRSLNVSTFSLLYLADFADRLEHEIIPALKAGHIVLADRYIYTAFARGIIRGAGKEWIHKVYGFALVPDAVFYMRIRIKDLVIRMLSSETLDKENLGANNELIDWWESGMDIRLKDDFYDTFVAYQKKMIAEFDALAEEFKFNIIDTSKNFNTVNAKLKEGISALLGPEEVADPVQNDSTDSNV